MDATTASTEASASVAHKPDILAPDVVLASLTWLTFFALLFILQKYAWKPILSGLKEREDYIRQSLLDADKTKEQLTEAEALKAKIVDEAKSQAAGIIDDARKTARALAIDIEQKAKQTAQDTVTNANAQIASERLRIKETLTKESAEIAIQLAGKILNENSDNERNRKLVESALKQI